MFELSCRCIVDTILCLENISSLVNVSWVYGFSLIDFHCKICSTFHKWSFWIICETYIVFVNFTWFVFFFNVLLYFYSYNSKTMGFMNFNILELNWTTWNITNELFLYWNYTELTFQLLWVIKSGLDINVPIPKI